MRLLAALLIVAGVFALMFEVKYFADFSINIYIGRLVATFIGFVVLFLTNYSFGKEHPIFLVHVLLITIISSFGSIILMIPESVFINSQLLSLIIFTSALFLSWDVKNQIIVAIYYNVLFSFSILFNNDSIYFLPSFFAAFIFVIFISLLSIVAAALNYQLRAEVLKKSIEAKNYLENASEGIFKISPDGKLLSVNKSFFKTLKFKSKNEIIDNMKFSELFENENDYESFIAEACENDLVQRKELLFTNYFKENISVLLNSRTLTDKNNNITAIEGSILDITDRVEAQRKIKEYNLELEKLNKSKDKFFSIVAHDLLSPFTSLLGFSEILHTESDTLSKEEIKEFSGDINSVAVNAHNLLENLLSWSSIQSGRTQFHPQEFNVFPVVEDVLMLNKGNANNKRIRLNNDIPDGFVVIADFNMFNTILRNLVANAVKFTNFGGKISVAVNVSDEFVEFYVKDNGVGMSEEDCNKLFKIDVHHSEIGTNNEKGTGLGLILCAEFIEKHDGTIRVESELGKGSKFLFTISKNINIA